MTGEARYRPDQAARILERAAALSRSETDRGGAYRRVTLGEIEQRAAELGIDREAVRRAAVELAGPSGTREERRGLLPPRKIELKTSTSARVGPSEVAGILRSIARHLGEPGTVSVEGAAARWTSSGRDNRRVELELWATSEGTMVVVREDLNPVSGGIVGGVVGGVGGGLGGGLAGLVGGGLKNPQLGLAVMLVVMIASLFIARAAILRVEARRREELAGVLGDLLAAVEATGKPARVGVGGLRVAGGESALEDDRVEAEAEAEAEAARRSRPVLDPVER